MGVEILKYAPLVSVIITNHNKWPFVKYALNSVLDQTYKDLEVIVVNDSTSDSSSAYLNEVADSRLTVFNVDFRNASKSRNFGFDKSNGEFIQYLDADDILDTEKIAIQLNSLKDAQLGLSVCRTMAISEQGLLQEEIDSEFLEESNPWKFIYSLYSNPYKGMVQPNAWFFSRNLHLLAGRWDEELSLDDDGEFFCRIILNSQQIIFCDERLNFYRKFENNNRSLSAIKNYHSMESHYRSCVLKIEWLKKSERFMNNEIECIVGSFYSVIAANAFLVNKNVCKKAISNTNDVGIWFTPYPSGFSRFFSLFIGWRGVKICKYLIFRVLKKGVY